MQRKKDHFLKGSVKRECQKGVSKGSGSKGSVKRSVKRECQKGVSVKRECQKGVSKGSEKGERKFLKMLS